ncbi:sensor histidine kinase [Streptomyces flaveus]|uniref:histidine kinase n=2 Tax=Streptomyces flaveus TaxID=66370 RepID=A0A917VM94_9ACTN|nr:two-component sensor histidine kinase [Streptomyces flaveus]
MLLRAQLPPVAFDALLVSLLFVMSVGPGQDLKARPESLILPVALLLPLVWRRRAPLAVFGAVAAAAFVQWLVGVQPVLADVALLVALYTVAVRSAWQHMLLAGAVLEGGILLASVRWGPEGRFLVPVLFLTALATTVAVTGTNIRIRRVYLASLEDRAVRLERERDQQAQLAVAEERARIAREMHDIVTHNLSAMVALADAAVFAQFRSPGKATGAMQQISDTGRQALTDMRRSLGVLRADEPDAQRHPLPGIAQLQSLVDQMGAAGLPTSLGLEGDPDPVSTTAQLTVYRVVQEALTNTLKHAPPGTRADVQVRFSPRAVAIEVTDDGNTTRAPGPSAGHGIAGMRERAAAYGGNLQAGPLPGGGWRVSAHITLAAAEDDAS